jgi:hypothetical protein
MDYFRDTAFYVTVWQAFLAVLASTILIVLNDFEPATALLIAANLALLFSLVLVARAGRLTDDNVSRREFWRALPPRRRPAGEAGLRMARRVLEETWLRFAKGAALVAIVMSALAYASHDVSLAARAPSMTASPPPGSTLVSTYRNGRLLPIY